MFTALRTTRDQNNFGFSCNLSACSLLTSRTVIFDLRLIIPVPRKPPAFVYTSTTDPSSTLHSASSVCFIPLPSAAANFTEPISLSNTQGYPCSISFSSFGFRKTLVHSLIRQVYPTFT